MINQNEAPKGFVAVAEIEACKGCSFFDNGECLNPKARCLPSERHDGEYVIFVPREKSNLAEFSNTGDLAEAKAEVAKLTVKLAELIKKNSELEKRVENQKERIRYLEGATNHATGTPLSKAKDEAATWKYAHDHVCKELAACEKARDENAKLWEEAQDEASRWKAACFERDELIAKLKAQLTTALESIARMR